MYKPRTVTNALKKKISVNNQKQICTLKRSLKLNLRLLIMSLLRNKKKYQILLGKFLI